MFNAHFRKGNVRGENYTIGAFGTARGGTWIATTSSVRARYFVQRFSWICLNLNEVELRVILKIQQSIHFFMFLILFLLEISNTKLNRNYCNISIFEQRSGSEKESRVGHEAYIEIPCCMASGIVNWFCLRRRKIFCRLDSSICGFADCPEVIQFVRDAINFFYWLSSPSKSIRETKHVLIVTLIMFPHT